MATSKPSANVFGTFLDNVTPGPSKSSVDFERITKQAIEWSTGETSASPAKSREAGPSPVGAILRAINDAGTPVSVVAIAKRAELNADLVTAALKDATFAGFITQTTGPSGVLFDLTADGRAMLHQ
jgi:hypothetical protein